MGPSKAHRSRHQYQAVLIRLLGIAGVALFVPLLLFTIVNPHAVEDSAKFFIEMKLQKDASQQIDTLQLPEANGLQSLLGGEVTKLRASADEELERIRQQLRDGLPAMLANELASLRDLDCECRSKWQQYFERTLLQRQLTLENAATQLVEFTHVRYMQIVTNLTADVQLFLSINALVFAFLCVLSFARPLAIKHLFLPGILLFISTCICSYFYIFEQNWLYSIIYNDYTGIAFIGYLALVFGFLCDIAFNRGRITTQCINTCVNALGGALQLVPC